jgi:exosortase/archaeosortase family protein
MKTADMVLRYLVMVFSGFFLSIFYIVFTPATVYPVYWLLKIFYSAGLSGLILTVNGKEIEIINACIAGAAYFLLLALNLSTRNIFLKKRVKILLVSFSAFLILNIARIFLLSVLLINEAFFFDIAHLLFWYVLSVLFVFLIWIFTAKIFRIKEIPFISDFCYLKKEIKSHHKGRK